MNFGESYSNGLVIDNSLLVLFLNNHI